MALSYEEKPIEEKLPEPKLVSTHEYKINPVAKVVVEERLVTKVKKNFYFITAETYIDDDGEIQVKHHKGEDNEEKKSGKTYEVRVLTLDLQEYVLDNEEEGTGVWKSISKMDQEFPEGYGRGYLKECIDNMVFHYREKYATKI